MSSNIHKHTHNVISALGNAPGFETIKAEDCKITRLGGMTNLVHLSKLRMRTLSYVSRVRELRII